MKPVIVFDLNETLLDLSALDPVFGRIFGEGEGPPLRKRWFQQLLELFLTATVVGRYRPFGELARDALHMLAEQEERKVTSGDVAALESALGAIPPYPDVRPGLQRLKRAGYTVATLTNSAERSATKLLERAGFLDLFDHVLSADAVERYKPAREAYAHAATTIGVPLGDICLAAAHSWDIAGASAAGCRTAFISRPGKVSSPGWPPPGLRARDIVDLAGQLATHAATS